MNYSHHAIHYILCLVYFITGSLYFLTSCTNFATSTPTNHHSILWIYEFGFCLLVCLFVLLLDCIGHRFALYSYVLYSYTELISLRDYVMAVSMMVTAVCSCNGFSYL